MLDLTASVDGRGAPTHLSAMKKFFTPSVLLVALAVSLSGCFWYPHHGYYGHPGYGPGPGPVGYAHPGPGPGPGPGYYHP
jgi:hypothetical protein